MKYLKGAMWEELENAFSDAIADEDEAIVADIFREVEKYEAKPSYKYHAYGEEKEHVYIHDFRWWMYLLKNGLAALPARMTREVLLAWRGDYDRERGFNGDCVLIWFICADCRMVLPGRWGWEDGCPVCGSKRLWHRDLSRAVGESWCEPVRPGRERRWHVTADGIFTEIKDE